MKRFGFILASFIFLLFLAGPAAAVPLAPDFEMDLDNWTRLYDGDVPLAEGLAPELGLESKAFITLNQIGSLLGPGTPDAPAYWVGGLSDGTYLHGVEKNVEISNIFTQADGGVNIYFDHITNDINDPDYWELEIYQTEISWAEFVQTDYVSGTAGNYLGLGPGAFDTIESNLASDPTSDLILQGRFAESTYLDPAGGLVNAVAAISLPNTFLGGEWRDQLHTPYGLGINAFIDINPLVGQGAEINAQYYGVSATSGEEYDMAIQNVGLFSENQQNVNNDVFADYGNWINSDDGVRGGSSNPIPEPGTMILLGMSLIGLAGIARRKTDRSS